MGNKGTDFTKAILMQLSAPSLLLRITGVLTNSLTPFLTLTVRGGHLPNYLSTTILSVKSALYFCPT